MIVSIYFVIFLTFWGGYMKLSEKVDAFYDSLSIKEREVFNDTLKLKILKYMVIDNIENRAVKDRLLRTIEECNKQLREQVE